MNDLFPMTPLKSVKDWGWHLYSVCYWRDEAHCDTGAEPLIVRQCIESEGGIGDYVQENSWPPAAGYVSWDVIEENVASRLRFVTGHGLGGTRVDGTGFVKREGNW